MANQPAPTASTAAMLALRDVCERIRKGQPIREVCAAADAIASRAAFVASDLHRLARMLRDTPPGWEDKSGHLMRKAVHRLAEYGLRPHCDGSRVWIDAMPETPPCSSNNAPGQWVMV